MGKVLKLCVCTCRHVHVQMCSPVHATYILAPMRIISEQENIKGRWRRDLERCHGPTHFLSALAFHCVATPFGSLNILATLFSI